MADQENSVTTDASDRNTVKLPRGHSEYMELVSAFSKSDETKLESLRSDWEKIRSFVELHDPDAALPSDKHSGLIMWLSTPPTHQPVKWTKASGIPDYVIDEREREISLVGQLWKSWDVGSGLEEMLESEFDTTDFGYTGKWLKNFRRTIKRIQSNENDLLTVDLCKNIVSSFSSMVEQWILDEGIDLDESHVAILGHTKPLQIVLPNGVVFRISDCIEAISGRIPLPTKLGKHILRMVLLSLPVHKEVLPNFTVEVTQTQCLLHSVREPLPL